MPRRSGLPAPLHRPTFRLLWLGWSISYAGDGLQVLAQTWLIALLTSSALAVAGSPVIAGLPLLLLPLGGVVADSFDRLRLLLLSQLVGGVATAAITVLVALHRIEVWEIYLWAGLYSLVRLVARPAYKVILTEAVPEGEARAAMAVSSMTETASLVAVGAVGALLLGLVGVTAAFAANTLTYAVAAWTLWRLRKADLPRLAESRHLTLRRTLDDLKETSSYLRRATDLLYPLVLTFLLLLAVSPLISLLAAVLHANGRSLVDLGLLSAATSLGTFAGAAYAGRARPHGDASALYARLGLVGAIALASFALLPVGFASAVPLAVVGLLFGMETVWNASRVAEIGAPAYQGRLQAITTMALALGSAFAALWAGPVARPLRNPRAAGAGGAPRSGVGLLRDPARPGRHAPQCHPRAALTAAAARGAASVGDRETRDCARRARPSGALRPTDRAGPSARPRASPGAEPRRVGRPASRAGLPRVRARRRSRPRTRKPGSATGTAERRRPGRRVQHPTSRRRRSRSRLGPKVLTGYPGVRSSRGRARL